MRLSPAKSVEVAFENCHSLTRRPADFGRGADRVLNEGKGRARSGELEYGDFVERKAHALGDARDDPPSHRKGRLREADDEVDAPDDRGTEPIDVIGDPDRWGDGSLDKPAHEQPASAS